MDVERKYNILKYMFIVAAVGIVGYHRYDVLKPADKTQIIKYEQLQNSEQIKQTADKAGVSLSDEQSAYIKNQIPNAKQQGSVSATAGTVHQIASEQQKQQGSDFAPVVSDGELSKLPDDTPINLNQYHIYAAPKVQHEIGVKLDADSGSHISGISYGIKRRISTEGKYIGVRADYDWKEKEAAVWLTYTY